ncbi:MAG TPA: hypothetical protein VFZ44_13400 [Pyrinomonadaceae bacterium]
MLTTVVVLFVFAVVVMPYVVAPLVVWAQHRQSAAVQFEHVSAESFPPEAYDFSRLVAHSLATQGFEPVAYLRGADTAARTVMYMLIMTSESARESAAAIDMRPEAMPQGGQRFVEFCTEFVGGREINTHNCGVAYITKPDPAKTLFRLHTLGNPALLYGAHRQLVERHAPDSPRFIPTRGTEHLHLAHSVDKGYRYQAESGYLYLDASAGVYRPTLKGACLMSWKLAWPVKQAREALAKRTATRTLCSLGR